MKTFLRKTLRQNPFELCVLIGCILFASWLMFSTFSVNPLTHEIRIAFKLWSDFGAHIPMIRSFSMGDNFTRFLHGTTQYPIFPGEPIKYHFLFFLLVGLLEKIGLRIDWALNIPSIIGMATLLLLLYILTYRLTRSKITGVLTMLFFLFNGSLGFMRFFILHSLSPHSLTDILLAKDFPAFAPWGPGLVTAFWNLNIYTNQRHLALAFGIGLGFILSCLHLERKTSVNLLPWVVFWSITLGLLPFFHQPLLLIIAVIMAVYFVVFPKLRLFLFTTGVITIALVIPQLHAARGSASPIEWYPGYIFHNEYSKLPFVQFMLSELEFWWQNIGLHIVLIPVGFIFLPKKSKLWLLPLLPLFIIPNLVKFSIEASANHKFFNFVMMIGQMCTAYILVLTIRRVTSYITKPSHADSVRVFAGGVAYAGIALLILSLTLSGIIDFFVIKNDTLGTLQDIRTNEVARWIVQNTPNDAIFLNSSYLYHPASIAGRAIFLGWPYFAWSAGYKENRMPIMDTMYETRDASIRCKLFEKYHITYITVENVKNDTNLPDIDLEYFLRLTTPVFQSKDKKYAIFTASSLCVQHR